MTHNSYDIVSDLIVPLKAFFDKVDDFEQTNKLYFGSDLLPHFNKLEKIKVKNY